MLLSLLIAMHALCAGPKKTGELSKEVATGCGLMKGQNDPPILPDDQYPAWLWTLLQPQPLVSELRTAYEGPGLTVAAMRRLWHYSNKQRIKERNTMKAKQ